MLLCAIYVSVIRRWAGRNGKNAIWKKEKKKIKRAPSITWSFPLPFPSYGNLYPRCLFRRSFFVSIVSSVIRFWEISDGERLYTLSYNSAPNMKNARHFQPCPNLCISSFQFSVMERMAEQWRFCHPSFISIKKAVRKREIFIRVKVKSMYNSKL